MPKKSMNEPESSRAPVKRKPSTPPKLGNTRAMIWPYALLSLGAFLCAMLVLYLMIWNQEILVRLGLVGRMFYVALMPLSLSVAAFLFGVFRSRALYTGKAFGGTLELAGPIVGAALTVIGGFALPPPDSTEFAVTIFVQGEQGASQSIVRTGAVTLDLGGNRRRETIGDKGQAYFPGIPARFRNQDVLVSIEAEGYELVHPARPIRLTNDSVYVPVRRQAGHVTGTVADENGTPLSGVAISIDGLSTQSDKTGHFTLTIPSDQMKSEFSLQAVAVGYTPSRLAVIPGKVDLILHRTP